MKSESIKPNSTKRENLYVLFTIVIIVLFSALLLKLTNKTAYTKDIEQNQISSLSLNNKEITIFSQLSLFLDDYNELEQEGVDLNPDNVGENLYYAPFAKDASWQANGKHTWYLYTHDNFAYYIGISFDKNVAGDFVGIINTKTYEHSVRYSKNFKEFDVSLDDAHLLKAINKLKEINAFTGEDFIKEMKGK